MYSLPVLRVGVAERDRVGGIVAPEEKPKTSKTTGGGGGGTDNRD